MHDRRSASSMVLGLSGIFRNHILCLNGQYFVRSVDLDFVSLESSWSLFDHSSAKRSRFRVFLFQLFFSCDTHQYLRMCCILLYFQLGAFLPFFICLSGPALARRKSFVLCMELVFYFRSFSKCKLSAPRWALDLRHNPLPLVSI